MMNKAKRKLKLVPPPPRAVQREETGRETRLVHVPKGARAGDEFSAVVMINTTLVDAGVRPSDLCVVFETSDLKSGDLVAIEGCYDGPVIRRFYAQPGGYMRFEQAEGGESDPWIYRPGEVEITGRVAHVERPLPGDGDETYIVPLSFQLRPLHGEGGA